MPLPHLVLQDQAPLPAADPARPWPVWAYIAVGTLLVAVIGSWLVWFSAYVQRKQTEEDIRAACHRVMPDSADRCFDTVIIQRGGVRR